MFDRRNLFPRPVKAGKWMSGIAKRLAERESFPGGSRVVLLGRRVAEAFDVLDLAEFRSHAPGESLGYKHRLGGNVVNVVPHPSGRNRWFNDPRNRDTYRAFWRRIAS